MPHAIQPVVVMPTYNNAETLLSVLERVVELGFPVVVVNDGCSDDSASLLERWTGEHPDSTVVVLTHEANRGKAAAMLTGFKEASQRGYTHAATMDSDGQLDPAQLPGLLEAARNSPNAIVLGVRDIHTENYPLGSRIGRSFSNAAIRAECGVRVTDSQCGLRVYPLKLIEQVGCKAGRFGWEAEIITRGVWAGCTIVEVPVTCIYAPRGQHKSHFRTWKDSWQGVRLHARLLARAIMPWPHDRFMDSDPVEQEKHSRQTALARVLHWINPIRAWKQVKDPSVGKGELSLAMGLGVFIANLPVYPMQSVLALYVAHRLHLHPAVVFAGSTVSTPPVGLGLIASAIVVGHFVLTGQWPSMEAFDPEKIGWMALVGRALIEWIIGSMIVGVVTAILAFGVTYLVVTAVRKRRPEDGPASQA